MLKLPFVLRSRLEKAQDGAEYFETMYRTARGTANVYGEKIDKLQGQVRHYEKRWGSEDGKVVLQALQDALNLIRDYQKNLATMSAPDPQYEEADALLERWGMKPHPFKVVRGAWKDGKSPFTETPTVVVDPETAVVQDVYEGHDGDSKHEERVEIIAERGDDGQDHIRFRPVASRDATVATDE